MSAADTLRQHAKELSEQTGIETEVVEEGGQLFVIFTKVPLPAGLFQVAATDVLFTADHQYPLSAMDMFWTELGVIHQDGSIPQNGEVVASYVGREWRRFSWHRNGAWNPNGNPLADHYAFMESRWTAR